MTGNATQETFSLVSGHEDTFRQTLLKRKQEIFPGGASFDEEAQEALAACIVKYVCY